MKTFVNVTWSGGGLGGSDLDLDLGTNEGTWVDDSWAGRVEVKVFSETDTI